MTNSVFKISTALAMVASATLFSASAIASGDAAKERQALMKNVGAATGAGAAMVKGEVEFNAVAAQLVLRTMNNGGLAFGYMFLKVLKLALKQKQLQRSGLTALALMLQSTNSMLTHLRK